MHSSWYDRKRRRVRDLSCGDTRMYLEFEVRRVLCQSCGQVKRERLDWMADNPPYTRSVRCRSNVAACGPMGLTASQSTSMTRER